MKHLIQKADLDSVQEGIMEEPVVMQVTEGNSLMYAKANFTNIVVSKSLETQSLTFEEHRPALSTTCDFADWYEWVKGLYYMAYNSYPYKNGEVFQKEYYAWTQVSQFGRHKSYGNDSSSWNQLDHIDTSTAIWNKMANEYMDFANVVSVNIPNGEVLEARHFWAAFSGTFTSAPLCTSWLGDLVQMAAGLKTNPSGVFPEVSGFDRSDWIADADSYIFARNMCNEIYEVGTLILEMPNYWNASLTEYKRCDEFMKVIKEWGNKNATIQFQINNKSMIDSGAFKILRGNYSVSEDEVKAATAKMQTYVDAVIAKGEIVTYTDLSITADNVAWDATTTTIHWTLTKSNGETESGTTTSEVFEKNETYSAKSLTISLTKEGLTKTTTITQSGKDVVFTGLTVTGDDVAWDKQCTTVRWTLHKSDGTTESGITVSDNIGINTTYEPRTITLSFSKEGFTEEYTFTQRGMSILYTGLDITADDVAADATTTTIHWTLHKNNGKDETGTETSETFGKNTSFYDKDVTISLTKEDFTTTVTIKQSGRTDYTSPLTANDDYPHWIKYVENIFNTIKESSKTNSEAMHILSQYGRVAEYDGGNWDSIDKINKTEAIWNTIYNTYPSFRTVEKVLMPNGDTLEVRHYWAAYSARFSNSPESGGWLGDIVQMAASLRKNPELTFPTPEDKGFGIGDWIADADAYATFQHKDDTPIAWMKGYWTSELTEKHRCEEFINTDYNQYGIRLYMRQDTASYVLKTNYCIDTKRVLDAMNKLVAYIYDKTGKTTPENELSSVNDITYSVENAEYNATSTKIWYAYPYTNGYIGLQSVDSKPIGVNPNKYDNTYKTAVISTGRISVDPTGENPYTNGENSFIHYGLDYDAVSVSVKNGYVTLDGYEGYVTLLSKMRNGEDYEYEYYVDLMDKNYGANNTFEEIPRTFNITYHGRTIECTVNQRAKAIVYTDLEISADDVTAVDTTTTIHWTLYKNNGETDTGTDVSGAFAQNDTFEDKSIEISYTKEGFTKKTNITQAAKVKTHDLSIEVADVAWDATTASISWTCVCNDGTTDRGTDTSEAFAKNDTFAEKSITITYSKHGQTVTKTIKQGAKPVEYTLSISVPESVAYNATTIPLTYTISGTDGSSSGGEGTSKAFTMNETFENREIEISFEINGLSASKKTIQLAKPVVYTDLTITADNVTADATTTTIHWTLYKNNGTTETGTDVSGAFAKNDTFEDKSVEISYTKEGFTKTATITQSAKAVVYVSLDITADDVNADDTTTTIHWTLTKNNGQTETGTATSDAFAKNDTFESKQITVSLTKEGFTKTATITQAGKDVVYTYLDITADSVDYDDTTTTIHWVLKNNKGETFTGNVESENFGINDTYEAISVEVSYEAYGLSATTTITQGAKPETFTLTITGTDVAWNATTAPISYVYQGTGNTYEEGTGVSNEFTANKTYANDTRRISFSYKGLTAYAIINISAKPNPIVNIEVSAKDVTASDTTTEITYKVTYESTATKTGTVISEVFEQNNKFEDVQRTVNVIIEGEQCSVTFKQAAKKVEYTGLKITASDVAWDATSVTVQWTLYKNDGTSEIGTDTVQITSNDTYEAKQLSIPYSKEGFNASYTITQAGMIKSTKQIVYTASSKLDETTSSYSSGVKTNVFNTTITSHTFANGQGVITFEEDVTSIGANAFYNCEDLTSITIPNSVTSIGASAFYQCTNITSITIPSCVTSINRNPFAGCVKLESITVASNNSRYDSRMNCNAIMDSDILIAGCKNTAIHSSTIIIGQAAFAQLSLTAIDIPNGVKQIYDDAFAQCDRLTSITIPDSVTSIGKNAFLFCTSLTSVTLGNNVQVIDANAFVNCSKITSITIPSSITQIGGQAFVGCSSLTSVTVEATNPPSLVQGAIPSNVTAIYVPSASVDTYKAATGWSAYAGIIKAIPTITYTASSKITSITEDAFNTTITSHTFANGQGVIKFAGDVTTIGDSAFMNCTGIMSMELPNSIISIEDFAFTNCYNMTSINIPDNVTSIGNCAFKDCSGLTSVSIPNGVTSLYDAFEGCYGLTSVKLSENLTNIGDSTFAGCLALYSITIPENVTTIGDFVFNLCENLNVVTMESSVPPTIGMDVFPSNVTAIYVPSASVDTYKSATGWRAYADIIKAITTNNVITYTASSKITSITEDAFNTTIASHTFENGQGVITFEEDVTSIGDSAFYECYDLTSIAIPNSVTSIGEDAFGYCEKLSSIIIPNNVTSIGSYAFEYCEILTSIVIPNGVISIDQSAFDSCSNLTSIKVASGNKVYDSRDNCNAIIKTATNELIVGCKSTTIPNSVTSIGNDAFNYCKGLTSIIIPYTVEHIGNSAFGNCTNLTLFAFPDKITNISENAFVNCIGLTSIYIPYNVESIGSGAFQGCTGLTSITIDAVTSIGNYAFRGCTGLTSITIPNSMTSIGSWAFDCCSSLTSITVQATTPPTLGSDAIPSNVTKIYVPSDSVNTYKAATNWSSFASKIQSIEVEMEDTYFVMSYTATTPSGEIKYTVNNEELTRNIELSGSLKTIDIVTALNCSSLSLETVNIHKAEGLKNLNMCFSKCTSLRSILLPALSNITSMNGCFYSCTSLKSVSLPSLPNVKDMIWCFNSCSSLTSISLPALSNVTGMYACFNCCESLMSISLPALPNVKSMFACFNNCASLTSITLPELPNVTSMSKCFYSCTSLKSISLPALPKVTNMGYCFYGCSSLTSVSLPALSNVTDMGHCFQHCTSLQNLTISALPNPACLSDWYLDSCTALNFSSLASIIDALPNTQIQRTCTLGATNLSKLNEYMISVATGKGWTLN